MRYLTYAVVLALLCSVGCIAAAIEHRCVFDELSRHRKPLPHSLVREVSGEKKRGWQAFTSSTPGWAPIRIAVFTLDMDDATKHCTAKGQKRPDFVGQLATCTKRDVFTPEKRATIVNQLLPAAVQMHRDRLLVEPVSGSIVVPNFQKDDICAQFTIPAAHQKTGVANVDMVLYAAAGPTGGSTLAWATPCSQLKNGRPVTGVMNFGPHSVAHSDANIRISVHEMAHALGFAYEQMAYHGMVKTEKHVRGKPSALMVISAKTVEKTREHFNCPNISGMELEDEGGPGTRHSHWERRNAKDELMAGIAGACLYTSLTMAAFEDMGYYRANWGKEEKMSWGLNKGCSLLTGPCVSKGVTAFPDMFCTSEESTMKCTSDRMGLGSCTLTKYSKPLPTQYQYFSDPKVGGSGSSDLMDLCPIIESYSNTDCRDGYLGAMPGSVTGSDARCLKGDGLTVDRKAVGDICAQVSCGKDKVVSVRYSGDATWHRCSEGEVIVPTTTFSRGQILCPRYEQVCAR